MVEPRQLTNSLIDDDFLDQVVKQKAETTLVDYKGRMSWSDLADRAKLTKCMLAFANSDGGGWIVLGVEENPKTVFTEVGLLEDQANTFEPTDMGKWINERCDPPISLAVYRREFRGNRFVIIRTDEFREVPSICTKNEGPQGKETLKIGALYFRNQNAESLQITRSPELRALIGLATRKQGDALVSLIRGVITGANLEEPHVAQSTALADRSAIDHYLTEQITEAAAAGTWHSELLPLADIPELFDKRSSGIQMVIGLQTRCHGVQVPAHFDDLSNLDNAMVWADTSMGYALSRSGVWLERAVRSSEPVGSGFVKRIQDTHKRWSGGMELGKYVVFQHAILEMACRFKIFSKLAARLPVNTPVRLTMQATRLKDELLISAGPEVIPESHACLVTEFYWSKDLDSALLSADGWKAYCADALFRIAEKFSVDLAKETCTRWVEWASEGSN